MEINNTNSAANQKNISNTLITKQNNEIKIESNSDKKIIESLFSEQNIFRGENKNEKLKNFFGEENLANEKNTSLPNNNSNNDNNPFNINKIFSGAVASSSNINKANNYFVNSNTHGYNSYNVNFKTNFFLDREFISKNFDVK